MDEESCATRSTVGQTKEELDAYSTLEVTPYSTLPEVTPDLTSPEVVSTESLPEVFKSEEEADSFKQLDERSVTNSSHERAKQRRLKLSLLVIGFLVILSAAIGSGIGGTIGRKPNSPPRSGLSLKDDSTLYPNTSLAAITLPTGERRLYFQDIWGSIREARYNTLIGTWDTDPSFVVTQSAWNGTALSADSGYTWDEATSFKQQTIIRLAFVSRHQQAGTSNPVVGALSQILTPDYKTSASWTDELNGMSSSLNCSVNTKLVIKVSHNSTRTNSSSEPIPNSWYNLLYQSVPEGGTEAPIFHLISSSGVRPFATDHENYIPASAPIGHAFTVGTFFFGSGPFGDLILPVTQSGGLRSNRISKLTANMWDNTCFESCAPVFSEFVQADTQADLVAVNTQPDIYQLFYLTPNLRMWSLTSNNTMNGNRTLEYGEAVTFDTRFDSGKFTVTADRYGTKQPRDMYVYTQVNDTYIAEFAYQSGRWSEEPTYILVR